MTYNPENGPPLDQDELRQNELRASAERLYWSFPPLDTGIPFDFDGAIEQRLISGFDHEHQRPEKILRVRSNPSEFMDLEPFSTFMQEETSLEMSMIRAAEALGIEEPHVDTMNFIRVVRFFLATDLVCPTLGFEGLARLPIEGGQRKAAELVDGKWVAATPGNWSEYVIGAIHRAPISDRERFIARIRLRTDVAL